jgi:EAL domain-containing protein (putative c-di-GMP-specific phosphodiesterase class I)/ActR/RegA family two-component response regulator
MQSSQDVGARGPAVKRIAYILDDEPQIAAFVCQVAVASGFEARQFSTPVPFLAQTKIVPPELIILDLALGQTDAIEVMRKLEILKYRGKVLLISGRDEATLSEIQRIGDSHGLAMLPSLRKPFRVHDLKERLSAFVETKEEAPKGKPAEIVMVDIAEALQNHWLELWYQAKIDLKTLQVCGAEALLRAHHPDLGLVLPAGLLPPTGDPLYRPLSGWVLARAMSDWAKFAEKGLPLRLSVNIPASVLHAPDFIRIVRHVLPQNPAFPGLIFEITEDDIIRDPAWVHELATQLKLYNVWISIDDFGKAYSSLNRLIELPCVELKLDRSFVVNCAADEAKRTLCRTVIALAHQFKASVCAEGVETAEDLRALIDLGCDTAQGYLFGRPMAPAAFAQQLLAQAKSRAQASAAAAAAG